MMAGEFDELDLAASGALGADRHLGRYRYGGLAEDVGSAALSPLDQLPPPGAGQGMGNPWDQGEAGGIPVPEADQGFATPQSPPPSGYEASGGDFGDEAHQRALGIAPGAISPDRYSPTLLGNQGGALGSGWSAVDDYGNPLPGAVRVTSSRERQRENIMAGISPGATAEQHWRAQQEEQRQERNAFAMGPAAYAQFQHARVLQQMIRAERVQQMDQQEQQAGTGVGAIGAGVAGGLGGRGQATTVDQEVANRVTAMRTQNPTARINVAQIRHQVESERRLAASAATAAANRPPISPQAAVALRRVDDQMRREWEQNVQWQQRYEAEGSRIPRDESNPHYREHHATMEAWNAERDRRRQDAWQELGLPGNPPRPQQQTPPEQGPLDRRQGESAHEYAFRLMREGPQYAQQAHLHIAEHTEEGARSVFQRYRDTIATLPEAQRATARTAIESAERMVEEHGPPARMNEEQRQAFNRQVSAIRTAFTAATPPAPRRQPVRGSGVFGIQMPWDQRRMVTEQ